MKQILTRAIKLKAVVGEPTVAIYKALEAGQIDKQPNGKPALGQTVLLGYVVGKAHEFFMHGRTKENPDGTKNEEKWPALRGDFIAFNKDRTLAHRSTTAFLMDHVTRQIGETIKAATIEGEPPPVVPIAFEVQVVTSDQGTAGFEWQLSPMIEMQPEQDPLADLIGLAGGVTKRSDAASLMSAGADPAGADGDGNAQDRGTDDASTTAKGGDKVSGAADDHKGGTGQIKRR